MDAQGDEITVEQAAENYAAEVARWREVRGMSKRALALAMGFDPSYVSHVESGRHKPSEEFSRLADEALNAGKAIWRRWCDYEQARARTRRPTATPPAQRRPEQPYATGSALVVEHDAARLQYDGSKYRLTMRRRLQCRLKNWMSRSCFSACWRDANVPRLRRLPVLAPGWRE